MAAWRKLPLLTSTGRICVPSHLKTQESSRGRAAPPLLCLLWFIDMNRGGQAPIIHEEPVQRQLGSVVRAGSINEWVCAVCACGVWVCGCGGGGLEGGGARPRRRRAPRTPESRCTLTDPVLPLSSSGTCWYQPGTTWCCELQRQRRWITEHAHTQKHTAKIQKDKHALQKYQSQDAGRPGRSWGDRRGGV